MVEAEVTVAGLESRCQIQGRPRHSGQQPQGLSRKTQGGSENPEEEVREGEAVRAGVGNKAF